MEFTWIDIEYSRMVHNPMPELAKGVILPRGRAGNAPMKWDILNIGFVAIRIRIRRRFRRIKATCVNSGCGIIKYIPIQVRIACLKS